MSDGDESAHERLLAGRYRLLSVVGRGGMGTVWRARDEMLGREVAVKEVLLRHELSDEERADRHRRTLREARASARLNHPGVVTVHDVVDEDDRPWIVMELVRARSVQEVLDQDGPLPPGRVAGIGRQVVGALRAAHAIGILHRDVKPANVLLTDDDRAILTDFGIAQVEGDATLTQTGLLMGSPAYMAPERLKGERAMPASDLWALGATLYAACEGKPPHHRSEAMAVLAAVMTLDPPPPRNAGPLGPVLYGLLRRDPVERLRAEQAEEMLAAVMAGSPVPSPAGTAGTAGTAGMAGAAGLAMGPAPAPVSVPAPTLSPEMAATGRTTGVPVPDLPTHDIARPYDGRTAAGTPPKKRSPAIMLLAAAATAAVITVIAGLVVFSQRGGGEEAPYDAAKVSPGQRTPGQGGTGGQATRNTAGASPAATPLPPGFTRVRVHGYSIGVPAHWTRKEQGNSTLWLDPDSDAYVQVDRTFWTGDPYAHWVQWDREVRSKGSLAGYRRVDLRRTTVGQRPAADIEFTWSTFRAVDRGVIADGRPFAVLVAVPAGQWNQYQRTVNNVLDTFQP